MHFKVYCQKTQENCQSSRHDDLHVYYGACDNFENNIPKLYSYLSDKEKIRANRFKFKLDFDCYVSSHALLRAELSKLLGVKAKSVKIEESVNGKPFTSGTALPFSLSRSKNLFIFAIGWGDQLVGVDIEQIKTRINFLDITRDYFSFNEQQSISSFKNTDDQNRTFFEIWTRKEALLKAVGIGINTELSKVQVLEGENHIAIQGVQSNYDKFFLSTIMINGAIISIASSEDFCPALINLCP
jgi:4'-phosphopantetheinyl transferase